jgi:hypothetical protein
MLLEYYVIQSLDSHFYKWEWFPVLCFGGGRLNLQRIVFVTGRALSAIVSTGHNSHRSLDVQL